MCPLLPPQELFASRSTDLRLKDSPLAAVAGGSGGGSMAYAGPATAMLLQPGRLGGVLTLVGYGLTPSALQLMVAECGPYLPPAPTPRTGKP